MRTTTIVLRSAALLAALGLIICTGCAVRSHAPTPVEGPIMVFESASQDQLAGITHPDLREELLAMVEVDQRARLQARAAMGKALQREQISADLGRVDRANTKRMKEIVENCGWPTRDMVGDDGAQGAWLLVQHADLDVAFQRLCLDLMRAELERDAVFAANVAYLTDRVLVNEGKPQIYATQFHTVDGKQQPRPMIDPDRVDQRRRSMGLSTLEEYRKLMRT